MTEPPARRRPVGLPDPPEVPVDPDADARALASTLRLRILRLCLDEERTNRQLAAALGRNPATVLHHVRTLVDRGFLVAGDVRPGPRGSREVPYRATGRSLHAGGPGQGRVLVETFLEEVALVDPADLDTARMGLRLDDVALGELRGRINDLLLDFHDRPAEPGARPWSVFVALHPDAGRDGADGPGPRTGQ